MKNTKRFPRGKYDYAMQIDWARLEAFAQERRRIGIIWLLVSKPIKFPAPDRRRREDREIPKAA